jgi:shikimate kinase
MPLPDLQGTSVFLVGMMGVGKTTVGKLLAQRLGYKFLDTDALVAQYAQQTIAEIFAQEGEAAFRELESGVLAQVASFTRLVVATGGGIVVRPHNWSHLRHGVVVWLDLPPAVLHERLVADAAPRPLLQTADPLGTLTHLYDQRRNSYAQADIGVMLTGEEPPEVVVNLIIEKLIASINPNRLHQIK